MPAPTLTRRAVLSGLAATAAAPGLAVAKAEPRPLPPGPMRGMTVSCPGYGRIWGSTAMGEALGELTGLGVNWTAVHPYAGVRRDGGIKWTPAEETGYLPRCIGIAKRARHHLFWKPHLAYWGSFEWRGAITFPDEAAWKRFFGHYREFIVDQARFAEKANLPMFSVGVEYRKTLGHVKAWRDIIWAVRKVYRGPITYAANWDEVGEVPFWKDLDFIGVQAYFPLADRPDASLEDLIAAWDRPMAQLTALSRKSGGRSVVFTEIGYPRSLHAAKMPWKPDTDDSARAIGLRTRLLEASLSRMAVEPLVRGAFWWKWIPGFAPWDNDFSMQNPEARAALKKHWART